MSEASYIYIINFDDHLSAKDTARLISPPGYFLQPMVSPKGDSVLFWGRGIGEIGFNIWNRDLRTNALKKLTDDRAVTGHPFWSADGKWIVFTSTLDASNETEWHMGNQFNTGRSTRNLWIMHHDGSVRRRLTTGSHADERPCFSPDGQHVVFVSDRSGYMNLWSADTKTGELRQVTDHSGLDYRPVFSPDGKKLAFFSSNNPLHLHDLCIMDWPDGQPRFPITAGQFAWIHAPFWIDNETILFHAAPLTDANCAIYLFTLKDKKARRVELAGISSYSHGTLDAHGKLLAFETWELLQR